MRHQVIRVIQVRKVRLAIKYIFFLNRTSSIYFGIRTKMRINEKSKGEYFSIKKNQCEHTFEGSNTITHVVQRAKPKKLKAIPTFLLAPYYFLLLQKLTPSNISKKCKKSNIKKIMSNCVNPISLSYLSYQHYQLSVICAWQKKCNLTLLTFLTNITYLPLFRLISNCAI